MIRDLVMKRSGGQCEAMVRLEQTWTRCGISPVDDHHMLTRSRGGGLLDEVNETYHHLACCRAHHNYAHSEAGRRNGLIIDGYAWLDSATGKIVYEGPDAYLKEKYAKAK